MQALLARAKTLQAPVAVFHFDAFGFLETDRPCAYPSSNNYDWPRHDIFLSLLAGARGVILQQDTKIKSPTGVQDGIYHKTGTVQFCTGPFSAIKTEADCKACVRKGWMTFIAL